MKIGTGSQLEIVAIITILTMIEKMGLTISMVEVEDLGQGLPDGVSKMGASQGEIKI